MNTIDYISKEKVKLLEAELNELKTVKRKEVLETLEFAKSLGDLSENAEYHQAREEQGKLEDRIAKIEHLLRTSVVVSPGASGTSVGIGSVVSVVKENTDEKKEYTIVGAEESDLPSGKISNHSPLGQSLMGKNKGDSFSIKTPKGEVSYKIISVK